MTSEPLLEGVEQRWQRIRERISSSGGTDACERITVVAVTKHHPAEVCQAALDAGIVDLGENYVVEALDKMKQVRGARWHFLGQLQTNKVAKLSGLVHLYQSIDRDSLVDRLAVCDPGSHGLIQVNLSGQQHRGGVEMDSFESLLARCIDRGLVIRGVMGVGPLGVDAAQTARAFEDLRSLMDRYGLEICSMGMSHDLEIALECGSTMLRIGTDLVGQRN